MGSRMGSQSPPPADRFGLDGSVELGAGVVFPWSLECTARAPKRSCGQIEIGIRRASTSRSDTRRSGQIQALHVDEAIEEDS